MPRRHDKHEDKPSEAPNQAGVDHKRREGPRAHLEKRSTKAGADAPATLLNHETSGY